MFDGLLHIRNYSTPVTIAISMAIASWFIGTISKQLQNEKLKNKIFKKVKKVKQKDNISTTNIAFIFLLSISFFYKDNGLSISYYSIFFLSLYIAWLSFKYNSLSVSNSVLITLGITSLFYTVISLGGGIWKLKLGGISIPEVVFLSIIPFAMSYIRLDSLRVTRILLLSIAVSISLLFIIFSYYDGNVLPDIFIKIRYGQNYFPLASFVLILLSSEILACFTWWRIKKTK